jgi:hypothetical protein
MRGGGESKVAKKERTEKTKIKGCSKRMGQCLYRIHTVLVSVVNVLDVCDSDVVVKVVGVKEDEVACSS